MAKRAIIVLVIIPLGLPGGFVWGQGAGGPSPAPASPTPAPPPAAGSGAGQWQDRLDGAARELASLNQNQAQNQTQAQAGEGPELERLRKQVELQQKQIEALLKMTQLLAEQVKKQTPATDAVSNLEERVATQEARAQQAAQRDQELAQAHDDLLDMVDAERTNGPALPSTLRETFLPSRTNESPLAIYGTVAQEYRAFSQQNATFRDRTLMLRPYLLLNEKWLMSANVALQINQVQLFRAQLERFVNDNLTVVIGRFYSPIGFYNERLRLDWVIKTPDPPLMFNQVYPLLLSFDGVSLRGSRYLGNWPVKLEYNGFVANGLSVAGSRLSPNTYANLNNFRDQIDDVNSAKAFGGRVGLSLPRTGLIFGLSGLANSDYDAAGHDLNLWDFDANWHRGNWDVRFEYAHANQQAPVTAIRREGLYAQLAYRRYNSMSPFFQRLEWLFRFDHVRFGGINLAQTGGNFGGISTNFIENMPIDRNRYTLGVNYWFYPSMVLKLAYEINDELGVPSLRDNGFLAQMAWGW